MAVKRYELRTFLDILNFCLEEIGETSSNTKVYNSLKRNINAIYLDEVVPEKNWDWLKKRVEVQTETYFSTGTVSVTANDQAITLTESPAKSYRGYFFGVDGHNEVYRIASHSANSSSITLE